MKLSKLPNICHLLGLLLRLLICTYYRYDADDNPIIKKKDIGPLAPLDHSKIDYAPINKNFYVEAPEIAKMTDDEVAAVRRKYGKWKRESGGERGERERRERKERRETRVTDRNDDVSFDV